MEFQQASAECVESLIANNKKPQSSRHDAHVFAFADPMFLYCWYLSLGVHLCLQALHYKEVEFQQAPAECVESLIAINKKLGQSEAALGILTYAQKRLGAVIDVQESWLAKLGHWDEALALYQQKVSQCILFTKALLLVSDCQVAMCMKPHPPLLCALDLSI